MVQTQTLLLVDLFTVQVDTVLLLERTLVLLQPMKLEIHIQQKTEKRVWLEPLLTASRTRSKGVNKTPPGVKFRDAAAAAGQFLTQIRCDYNWVGNLTFFTLVSADRHDFFIIRRKSLELHAPQDVLFSNPDRNTFGVYTCETIAFARKVITPGHNFEFTSNAHNNALHKTIKSSSFTAKQAQKSKNFRSADGKTVPDQPS